MDIELVNHIKKQVIDELKKEYVLVRKYDALDNTGVDRKARNETFLAYATDVTCEYFKIHKSVVMSGVKMGNTAHIRHIVCMLSREICKKPIPYEEIAAFFGKHHATMMYGHTQVAKISEVDKNYKQDVDSIIETIKNNFYKKID